MMKTRSEENSTHHLRIVYEVLNIDESSCIEIQYVTWIFHLKLKNTMLWADNKIRWKKHWGGRPTLVLQTRKDLHLSSGKQKELSSRLCAVKWMAKRNGQELKNRIQNNPSKKVTYLVRMERLLRNGFGNSGRRNQNVWCICNKGTQMFYSDLAVECTDKKSAIRSFWEIYKVALCLKCSYEWRKGRGDLEVDARCL